MNESMAFPTTKRPRAVDARAGAGISTTTAPAMAGGTVMSIEAMKQALEALTRIWEDGLENFPESAHDSAITALRTAIEQAEKQDFRGARLVLTPDGVKQDGRMGDQPAASVQDDLADFIAGAFGVSRGTAYDMMREALKEAAPVQEPVAGPRMTIDASAPIVMTPHPAFTRQPAAQRQWVGLTDGELNHLYATHHDKFGQPLNASQNGWAYERAIEAKLRSKNTPEQKGN